jgi:trans-AT polyketide synthase/acyltransferase/oxidoreductase domain-containing protein
MTAVAWMFSGQGSQYTGMGRDLYERHATFRTQMDLCDEIAQKLTGRSFLSAIYDGNRAVQLRDTWLTNPALFAVQYSGAQMLLAEGARPDVLVGYSLGEFVAHAVASAISPEAALRALIAVPDCLDRARRNGMAEGGMTAVIANAGLMEADRHLFAGCWLAAVNGRNNFVVSATLPALSRLEAALRRERVPFERLPVEYPFHSPLIDEIETAFVERIAGLQRQPGWIPVIPARAAAADVEATPGELWRAVRDTVRFDRTAIGLAGTGVGLAVDLGPSGTLAAAAKAPLGAGRVVGLMPPFRGVPSDVAGLMARHRDARACAART